jgi:hypothetical protein
VPRRLRLTAAHVGERPGGVAQHRNLGLGMWKRRRSYRCIATFIPQGPVQYYRLGHEPVSDRRRS